MSELMQASRQWASRPSDERFTSLHSLHAHCVAQRDNSRGVVASTKRLELRPTSDELDAGLLLHGPNGHGYEPSNWAFGQLCARVGAPAAYLGTLPAAMAADLVNYGLIAKAADDVGVLLTRNGGDTVRAITGPNYGRIWNSEITRQLTDRFGDGVTGDWRVPGEFGHAVDVTKENTTLYAGDRDMFVFLADEKNRVEIPRPGRHGGESIRSPMARGFFCWNSEVGSATFGLAQFLFDYVCCNRIVWGATEYKETRIRHTVSAPDKFIEAAEPALLQISHASTAGLVSVVEAAQAKKVDDLGAFLKTRRFGANMAAKLNALHKEEEGRPIETVWDVTTALTAHARSVEHQDARVELEREAGKILQLAA